jgi:hypothetical protein
MMLGKLKKKPFLSADVRVLSSWRKPMSKTTDVQPKTQAEIESNKLQRKFIGTRVTYVLTAVLCYFGSMFVITKFGTYIPSDPELVKAMVEVGLNVEPVEVLNQEQVWAALEWLIVAIGVAVAGDTARPNGQKATSFSVTSNGKK